MTDVGDGQMADDGGQCFETTVRWDSLKELDPFMGSELANEKLTVTMGYIYLSLKLRYRDMIQTFAKTLPILSIITNHMIDYVHNVHDIIELNCNREVPSPVNPQTYFDAVTAREAQLTNCFRFIRGTVRRISRSGEHQQPLYNGHKRVHAVKF